MKKKIFSVILLAALAISAATGCSQKQTAEQGENTQAEEQESSKKKSSKHKYDDINADSEPIGVDEVKFSNSEDNYTYVSGIIYKNGGDIEESFVTVTFELYDDNGEYFAKKSITTNEALGEGDQERFSDNIIWEASEKYKKNVDSEELAKYTAKIVNIEETDVSDAELQDTIDEIEDIISYSPEDYGKAQILLDEALKNNPDNVDLKLLQEELNKAVAKENEGE